MNWEEKSPEVFVAPGGIVQVKSNDLDRLKTNARESPKKRSRLCAHPGPEDRLHEMLIVLDRSTYVRPHRHRDKAESFHIIEGEVDVFLFSDQGEVTDVIRMGDYRSGKPFYYRMMDEVFHAPVISTEFALFHETTNGPFQKEDTEMAPWAPDENDTVASQAYLNELRTKL